MQISTLLILQIKLLSADGVARIKIAKTTRVGWIILASIKSIAEKSAAKKGTVKKIAKDAIKENIVKSVIELINRYSAIIVRVLIIKIT